MGTPSSGLANIVVMGTHSSGLALRLPPISFTPDTVRFLHTGSDDLFFKGFLLASPCWSEFVEAVEASAVKEPFDPTSTVRSVAIRPAVLQQTVVPVPLPLDG